MSLDDLGDLFAKLADLSLEELPGGTAFRIEGNFDPQVRLRPEDVSVPTADGLSMLDQADLDERERRGWFKWLQPDEDLALPRGIQLYVLERLRLFVALEARGWGDEELIEYAEFEDELVSGDVDSESGDLPYIDDDMALLAREQRETLRRFEDEQQRRLPAEKRREGWQSTGWSSDVAALTDVELEARRAEAARHLARLDQPLASFGPKAQNELKRAAAWSRARNEFLRVLLISPERLQLEAGFSLSIMFRGPQALMPNPADPNSFGQIDWTQTLRSPKLLDNLDTALLRVPGLTLRGERITTDRVMPPSDYTRLYQRFRLGDYLVALASQRGSRYCAQCQAPLIAGAAASKKYCSTRCSAAARQRSYRQRAKAAIVHRVRREGPDG